MMIEKGFHIKELPELHYPLLVAGFDGWGNAMNISNGMAAYLIRKLKARSFATINSDIFYHYDETRPFVNIQDGNLKSLTPPGGSFYAVQTQSNQRDLVILKADEPNLRWFHFANELISLCIDLGVNTIITLGSMYDNVLHTDRIVSGIASTNDLTERLKTKNIRSVSYQGPSAIHSTLIMEGTQKGFQCISLWTHCPYYLQGVTHYGLLSHLGSLLSFLGEFELDISDLEASWRELNEQIQGLVENNPGLQSVIDELRKAKVRGSWERMKESAQKNDKVINLKDFLEPR